jgi:hypothetical protein
MGARGEVKNGPLVTLFRPQEGVQAFLQLRRELPEHPGAEVPVRDGAAVPQSAAAEVQKSQSSQLHQSD